MRKSKLYDFLLIIPSILIWVLMCLGKFVPYDDNIILLGLALLISFIVSVSIVLTWFFKRQLIKESALVTILFLITSSPFSIYFFIEILGGAQSWKK